MMDDNLNSLIYTMEPSILQKTIRPNINYFKYFFGICVTVLMFLLVIYITDHGVSVGVFNQKPPFKVSLESNISKSNNPIIILTWPGAFMKCTNDMPVNIQGDKCENKCKQVCDTELYSKADAVVFNLCYNKEFPKYRPPHQKWVILDMEAPPQSNYGWPNKWLINKIKNSFNITSFLDSSSMVPNHFPPFRYKNRTALQLLREQKTDFMGNKSRNVAWFVSHCSTQSQREDYVRELQKWIDVDIYGRCGNLSCGSRWERNIQCKTDLLNTKYKFYLAFENSLCQDYASEKLFGMISLNIIPVVMGLANYSKLLPPKSYIDVHDFKSPRRLADFLWHVGNDRDRYNRYVTRLHTLERNKPGKHYYLCNLCQHISEHKDETEIAPDVAAYWSVENKCISPRDYIPGTFWTNENKVY